MATASYRQVKGLPVVPAGGGEQIGTVKDLVIDTEDLRVAWLKVDDGKLIGGHDQWQDCNAYSRAEQDQVAGRAGAQGKAERSRDSRRVHHIEQDRDDDQKLPI